MLLGLHKNLTFNSGKIYPYAIGGDYVYLYEEDGKTYRVHEFLSTGTSTLNVEVGGEMEYLVVGGGGGGGRGKGGGGGGGGALYGSTNVSEENITISVGAGGTGAIYSPASGARNGMDSSFNDIVAYGGGFGGFSWTQYTAEVEPDGGTGGAGGGGIGVRNDTPGTGAPGITGQGYAGGAGVSTSSTATCAGGGGGGAGEIGQNASNSVGGNGGSGIEWPTGSGNYYGGGGGGYVESGTPGSGGTGGGGAGAPSTDPYDGENGLTNTGGGGGGGGGGFQSNGGDGGSGIVIVRYVIAEKKLWTPSELTNVVVWLDGNQQTYYSDASGGSLVTTDGSTVKRWEDISGNSNHVSNSSSPVVLKVGSLNGKNYLDSPAGAAQAALKILNSNLGRNVANLSVVTVAQMQTSYVNRGLYCLYANGSGKKRAHVYTDDNVFKYNCIRLDSDTQARTSPDTGFFPTSVSSTTSDWIISLTTSRFSQQSFRAYINGTVRRDDTVTGWTGNSSDTTSDVFAVMAGDFEAQASNWASDCAMAEFLLIHDDVAFDTETRQKLEGYLAHKWGLTNNLPTGHPYKYEPPYKVEPEEIVTDGLVLNLDAGDYASYPRSGTTWYDITGNGYNGTLTNGPTYDSANKGSIVFDGANDYVSVPSFNADSNQALSVFCWFNGSDLTNKTASYYYSWFVNKRDNGSDRQWQLLTRENVAGGLDHRIGFYWWDTTSPTQNSQSIFGTTTLSENTWYYGGFVTDGANATLYLNGSSEATGTLGGTGVRKTGSRELVIATSAWNYTALPLNGKIPVVQIYNRALSSTEITQNFNALRGRYGI